MDAPPAAQKMNAAVTIVGAINLDGGGVDLVGKPLELLQCLLELITALGDRAGTRASGDQDGHVVQADVGVARDQGQALGARLRYEEAIKWIRVMIGQLANGKRVRDRDSQRGESLRV
jgi:hypothetical protein